MDASSSSNQNVNCVCVIRRSDLQFDPCVEGHNGRQ